MPKELMEANSFSFWNMQQVESYLIELVSLIVIRSLLMLCDKHNKKIIIMMIIMFIYFDYTVSTDQLVCMDRN